MDVVDVLKQFTPDYQKLDPESDSDDVENLTEEQLLEMIHLADQINENNIVNNDLVSESSSSESSLDENEQTNNFSVSFSTSDFPPPEQ